MSSSSSSPSPKPTTRRPSAVSWPVAITIIALAVLVTGSLLFVYVVRQAKAGAEATVEAGRQGIVALKGIAAAFRTGEITTSFSSFTTQIEGSSRFQFATIDQLELFERSDSATAFWGQIELPKIVVEARAPVQYSYFLDLNGEWRFTLDGSTLTVQAPSIEFNRPAFNPSRIDYRISQDSLWRDEEAVLQALRLGLGEMAQTRARENISLVRELGRQRAATFVEQWLLANFEVEAKDVEVVLYFADEDAPLASTSALSTSTRSVAPSERTPSAAPP